MNAASSFKSILCPVDFSDGSRRALAHASALAALGQGRVTVLHVTPVFPATIPEVPYWPVPLLAQTEDAGEVLAALETFVAPFRGLGATIDTRVTIGLPEIEIVKAARTLPADLLAMGTRGASGLALLLVGSVTEKVLRELPCPVLAVNPETPAPSEAPFKRIVCLVDLLEDSASTLQYGEALSRAAGGTLAAFHVVEGIPRDHLGVEVSPVPEYQLYRLEAARKRLHRLVGDSVAGSVAEAVVAGKAYKEIVRISRTFDLAILGAHASRPVGDLFLGSTAAHVVRDAYCPVLTVPKWARRAGTTAGAVGETSVQGR